MSGIIGFWNLDGRPTAVEEIDRMCEAIAHRGPNGARRLIDGAAALGYLHLETRRKPVPVNQPFTDSGSGLSVTLDGRIDNGAELRATMQQHEVRVQSVSDAELILRAYQLWGVECPAHLLGDFSFALWDPRNQLFFCARDQLGVKPFLYHYSPHSLFICASEILAIVAIERVPRRLNEYRLADYLVNELDRDDTTGTFYKGILRLPGGHCLMAKRDSVKTWNYWKLESKEGESYSSMEECAEVFRGLLVQAVSGRVSETDSVGYALSGGLDSSSVVAVARDLSSASSGGNLSTFSLVDPVAQEATKMIHSVVDQGGINPCLLRPEDVTAENYDLEGLIQKSDQPFEVDQGFFDWITFRAARRSNCRVFLDGLDGDQINPSIRYLSSLLRRGLWKQAIQDASYVSQEWKIPVWQILVRNGLFPILPRTTQMLVNIKRAIRSPAETEPVWISDELARRTCVSERMEARRQDMLLAARDPFRLHALSFTSGLVSFALEGADKIASLLALELRHPFWDRRIAEFLIALPLQKKGDSPRSKNILRTAMRGLLPDQLLRQRRLPHPGPVFHARILDCHSKWLSANIETALQHLRGYVNVNAIDRIHQYYRSTKQSAAGMTLWNVAVLASWIKGRGLGIG